MKYFKKIKKFFVLALLCSFVAGATAQSGSKLMIDEDSSFALQSVPIYEGIEEFQEKLDKIRIEKGREPLGLVLCGGSARAFSHIGALKALEENDVTPDFIVANSMGAIIGMFYAYGFSPDVISKIISEISLTEYFELVFPLHGGFLSTRKYRAFVNSLLGKEKTDLSECEIPILVLTEDLYTKRQIWHASGDFSKVMTAAFAMSAIMEPTKYELNNEEKTQVSLIDSGAIDIAGLSVAESFSKNIIISTAFYDKALNYDNPLVVLNRTMSIGKERRASEDIKRYKPVIIRNDVEQFSFMAFDKAKELSDIGYESANSVMEDILNCPHEKKDLSERRAITKKLAENEIKNVYSGEPLKPGESYFGMKLWPVFSNVDYKDYFLYERNTASLFAFGESSSIYSNIGVSFPFGEDFFAIDANLKYNPSSVFSANVFASYGINMKSFKPQQFFGATSLKLRPVFFPYAMKSLFLTAEYFGSGDFNPIEYFAKSGIHFSSGKLNSAFYNLKPYYYVYGKSTEQLSDGIGLSLEFSLTTSVFSKKPQKFAFGLGENFSARYGISSLFNNNLKSMRVLNSDYYRAKNCLEENDFVATNSLELYFINLDPDVTAAELFILQAFKIGAFYDAAYVLTLNECAGAFLRTQISLVGLCNFIFEGGCGWDFNKKNVFGYFSMKSNI